VHQFVVKHTEKVKADVLLSTLTSI